MGTLRYDALSGRLEGSCVSRKGGNQKNLKELQLPDLERRLVAMAAVFRNPRAVMEKGRQVLCYSLSGGLNSLGELWCFLELHHGGMTCLGP